VALLGSFFFLYVAGFTINVMTLMALSLCVGLLIDDAIVVRENIFRHIELGVDPMTAARRGTAEVRLAVIATTLTVLAVFGPVAFMKGFTGQFFKQFGLTICFAMIISLFDALTIAPMLSAYFAGKTDHGNDRSIWNLTMGRLLRGFGKFQDRLEAVYERLLRFTVRRSLLVLFLSLLIAIACFATVIFVPKTFFPPHDAGEFAVSLEMPPGTNLATMSEVALEADKIIQNNKEVTIRALTVGSRSGESNQAEFYIRLVSSKERQVTTTDMKNRLRDQLQPLAHANPKVRDYDPSGGQALPFNLMILSNDQTKLDEYSQKVFERLKKVPGLIDVDSSYRAGKSEFQIIPDPAKAQRLGISTRQLGNELRAQVEGVVAAKYREAGLEYDIRVRIQENQRNLRDYFSELVVPNINDRLVPLTAFAKPLNTVGPSAINRQNRGRYVQFSADIAAGAGLGDIMKVVEKIFKEEIKLPAGVRYAYIGDSENFQEFGTAIGIALGFALLFIFMVLSSLYESFVTPFTIMLALPLAICGAMVGLFVANESVNLFSMIGVIMLLGISSKNSILLVDLTRQLVEEGMDRSAALVQAGKTRLRPILMTTMALIAGSIPVAIGLNEASRNRTSMGAAIIGGLISSTLLTLVVVPAAYSFIDRFRVWSRDILVKRFVSGASKPEK
jgi:HAE1 family hydrophobic/amphiphilic exporter-1